MKKPNYFILILPILTLFLFSGSSSAQFDGYVLYNKQGENTAYLIDKDQNIAKTWTSSYIGNYTVHLKEDGNLIRGGFYDKPSPFSTGGAIGGVVEEIDPSNNVVWEFVYSDANHVSHHDFCVLPNGNVILIAWEIKNETELLQAGWLENRSSFFGTDKWPTHFIEIQPDGTGGATIVWEWHIWDHFVQDVDNTKDNYGNVANNPQLMDINAVRIDEFSGGSNVDDWFHVNGIDYNPTLDQLVFSSRWASEIFIIDHSTTTAEAASHSGGNSGMGGDFLYRYGNAPNHGSSLPQIIPAAVHDPRWIKPGRPNEGYIQFFNNSDFFNSSTNATIDAINPPLSGYNYTSYTSPSKHDWRHTTTANSGGTGASDRMTNGNTFVNHSSKYMYEIDALGNTVWQYAETSAKAFRYECDYPGLAALLGTVPCNCNTADIDYQSACTNYKWIDGNTYSTSNNTATHTLINANGCDSVVTLNLTINSFIASTDVQTTCGSYQWIDGNTYSSDNNTATHTITGGAVNGCDSVVTLNLTINSFIASTDVQTTCGSYQWIDGNTYSSNNNTATHTITGGAVNGCDSVVTLNLTINSFIASTDVQTTCGSYQWIDGNTYSSDNNTATQTITDGAVNGCDSVVTLNLTINSFIASTDVQTTCGSYQWIDGNTYSSNNNTATHTITGGAVNGCDSVVTLDLTINTADVSTTNSNDSITANAASASYQWLDCGNSNSLIPGETKALFVAKINGSYAVEVTQNGCIDTSSCTNITISNIGEYSFGNKLILFPNPTNGDFSIDLGENYKFISIDITDIRGKIIQSKTYDNGKLLNLKVDAPVGIYILKIESGSKKKIIKLIKK